MRKWVGAVAVVGAVISGCGGPDQAGSAVIIGTDTVPLERVQSQLDVALSKTDQLAELGAQGGAPADIARSIVTREVIHDLLQRQAAVEGIAVTDEQVDAALTEGGGSDAIVGSSLYDATTLRERVRDDLVAAQLGARSAPGLAVTADLVAATSQAEATEKAQVLAAGGPAADALFADRQTSARGSEYQAVTAPDAAATVLFGTPVGGVVAFQPDPQQSTWIVFRVTDRRTDAPSDPQAANAISRAQLVAIGERLLQPVSEEVGVRVNPRYGVWDPIQLRVVPDDQAAGTILPPVPAG